MSNQTTLDKMIDSGVVGVIRTESSEKLLKVSEALKVGGVSCIEVAMTTPDALTVIEEVSGQLDDVLIGAGTVLDAETARSAILAGAEYLVSPTTDLDMIEMCKRYDKVVAPGAFTPTEVMKAWQAGADIVKVFPASRLGPKFISDIKAPLPQASLMPTGGVSQDNAADYIRAGADAVCAGSALLDKQAIAKENWEVLTSNAKQLVEAVKEGRKTL
ncbi:MAG: bifunctional 4-hydroxy-2-oxoglutarate aldolase/2-dehydro-3-deoxy-phosphogluconate aldolase [Candidatus Bipolaricaulota bacterium]|nr:bifunctional 4-hydroxy-2-oxoglutarate aldolase/2-dehydro-3-deoxy-phosphogluconate aldolase [Candidatus Bipolaricaulota bacterium]